MERRIRLQVNNGQDIEFTGQLQGEYSTQNSAATKDRWTEIRLWETAAGAWIVESVGCSTRRGEAELRDALVMERADGGVPHDVRRVMDFLGWTTVAKAFAREMGWDVVRDIA